MTRNQTLDHGTISLEKFATRVASAVDRFFNVGTLVFYISFFWVTVQF